MGKSAHIRARRRRRARLSGRWEQEVGERQAKRVATEYESTATFRARREQEKQARAMELVKYPVVKRAR